MTATRAPIHYLKASKTTWSPPHLYVLDTETRTVVQGETEVEALRLWCAKIIDRRPDAKTDRASRWTRGTTADGLARSIEHAAQYRDTLWLFAHNLGFDLVTTRLPLVLIEHGWTVGDFALSGDTPWMRMSKGKHSLTMVDSVSFLPCSVAELGRMLGLRKPPLPKRNASEATWLRRCRADVSILAAALVELMDWHDVHGRGYWSLTGTATAWGHMRQRLPERVMVIDPSPEGQAHDRQAMYGGRRACWRVGTFRGRRYLEVDIVAAYPTAAKTLSVPIRRVETFDSIPLDHAVLDRNDLGFLARCLVKADMARYPLRHADATWYPTGEFWTTLAGPEVAVARDRGDLLAIGPGELHLVAPVLADWATWLLAQRELPAELLSEVVRHSLKVWGRTVIGRFGGHSWTRRELGPAPEPGWHYEPGVSGTTGLPGGMVDLGGTRWWTEQAEGADNAYPAVTAWVESAVRVALAKTIDLVGESAVVYANTDGLVVAESALGRTPDAGAVSAPDGLSGAARTGWVLDAVSDALRPFQLAVKRSTTNLTVLGPTHVRWGAQRKLAGIPANADENAPGRFSFRTWPTMTWQMAEGDATGYHRPMVVRTVDGPYPAGWVLDDGTVFPPAATVGRDGQTRLLSWARTPHRPVGRGLHGPQHPVLDALL